MKKLFYILIIMVVLVGCSTPIKESTSNKNSSNISAKEDRKIKVFLYSLINEVSGLKEIAVSKNTKNSNHQNDNFYLIKLDSDIENLTGIITINLNVKYKPNIIKYKSNNTYNTSDLTRFLEIESSVFNNKLVSEVENIENIEFDMDSKISTQYKNIIITIEKMENKTLYTAEITTIK